MNNLKIGIFNHRLIVTLKFCSFEAYSLLERGYTQEHTFCQLLTKNIDKKAVFYLLTQFKAQIFCISNVQKYKKFDFRRKNV